VDTRAQCDAGRSMRFAVSAVSLVLMLAAGLPAMSQTAPVAADGGEPKGVKTREWVQKGAQKVVEIDFGEGEVFYGKVQKPGVDYLITQGDLAYEGLPLEHDLLRALEQSVKAPPF